MAPSDVDLVRRAWSAFARGDVDAAVSAFAPDVRWHGPEDDGTGCRSRDEALTSIRRALANGVTAQATDVHAVGDRVVVTVRTRHPPDWGPQPETHGEVVTVRGGEVVEMLVDETVDQALDAARAKL